MSVCRVVFHDFMQPHNRKLLQFYAARTIVNLHNSTRCHVVSLMFACTYFHHTPSNAVLSNHCTPSSAYTRYVYSLLRVQYGRQSKAILLKNGNSDDLVCLLHFSQYVRNFMQNVPAANVSILYNCSRILTVQQLLRSTVY